MIYALEAIETTLVADTVTAPIVSGSSTTVIHLGPGGAAQWVDVEHVYLTGSGSTLANHRDTRRIIAAALDRVTLDRPLSVAPAAGDTLNGGFREWVMTPGAAPNDKRIYYVQRGEADSPAVNLLKTESAATIGPCVVLYGELTGVPAGFGNEERWRFRVLSRLADWAAACAARIARKLDGKSAALTIPGRQVFSIEMSTVAPQFRTDVLIQKDLKGAIVTAKAAA